MAMSLKGIVTMGMESTGSVYRAIVVELYRIHKA